MSQEVTKKEESEIQVYDGPVENEFGSNDLAFQYIIIAQDKSKAIIERDPGYIKGLKSGDFFNSVSREIYGKEINVIYVHMIKVYQVYNDQSWIETMSKEEFDILSNKVFDKKLGWLTDEKPNCNIKENWKYFFILPDHPEVPFVVLTVKPGGLGEAKIFNTKITSLIQKVRTDNPTDMYPYQRAIWVISTFEKESKLTENESFQISGTNIHPFIDEKGIIQYASNSDYRKAIAVKQMIVESEQKFKVSQEEY